MSRPFFIATSHKKTRIVAGTVDIAARYLVYKLYFATDGRPGAWHAIHELGEKRATVERAVERGWVVIREEKGGKAKVRQSSASLTNEGKLVARKGLMG